MIRPRIDGDAAIVGDAAFLPDAARRSGPSSSHEHGLPLVQFLDDHGVTGRIGDGRVLMDTSDGSTRRLANAISWGRGP
jgi:hypothetical protein